MVKKKRPSNFESFDNKQRLKKLKFAEAERVKADNLESRADLDLEESSINAIGQRGDSSLKKTNSRRGTRAKAGKSGRRNSQMSMSSRRDGSERHRVEPVFVDIDGKKNRKKFIKEGKRTLESVAS